MSGIKFSPEQMSKLKNAMNRAAQPNADLAAALMAAKAAADAQNAEGEQGDGEVGAIETNLAEGTYLRVDEDDMAAWLYLAPPAEGQTYTKNELISYLEQNGVIRGHHSSNLSAIIKKRVYDREILVARGAECVDGKDGYFEYLFSPEEYGVPKIREDGSVDYTNVSAL